MKIRIGLLPVSLATLCLAIAAFHLQATQADPVKVADFGVAPAAIADADMNVDETADSAHDPWLHPAAAQDVKDLCVGSTDVNVVGLSASVSIVCNDDKVAGVLMLAPGQPPQLLLAPDATDDAIDSEDTEPSA